MPVVYKTKQYESIQVSNEDIQIVLNETEKTQKRAEYWMGNCWSNDAE